MRLRGWVMLAALTLGAGHAEAQVAKLPPVDEAAGNAQLRGFRDGLLQAVRRRDSQAVLAALAPDVRNSFGGSGGVEEFKATWEPDNPLSNLWAVLEEVLRLGGAFEGANTFVAPYVTPKWPRGIDPSLHVAATVADLRVRERPDLTSPVIGVLSYDVVPLARDRGGDDATSRWQAVRLADGRRGYTARRYLRQPTDYRAVFERRQGRWMLAALVEGD